MKRVMLLGLILVMAGFITAENVVVLEDLLKPEILFLDNTQMYITEDASIYIYSLKDFKLLKKFGKKGQGPQEFALNPQIGIPLILDVQSDHIIANSISKVSFFKKNGDFVKEYKITGGLFSGWFQPIGNKYVGFSFTTENQTMYWCVNLYDKEFKKLNEIHKQPHFFQQGKKMNPLARPPIFQSINDRILIDPCNGELYLYNQKGEKTVTIRHEYKKMKFTSDHKKQMIQMFETDPQWKQFYQFLKNSIEFPEYFPEIQFAVPDKKYVYVTTYHRQNGKAEFFIFDYDGKLIKRLFVPFRDKDISQGFPYTIRNGILFQLNENEDEEWELHRTKIQ